ncbi:MAG: hypothetical protein JSU01_03415 [Bacteroidetes bacterium]|nr:hypothetical protein [Bacteroidota bacterium]
MKLILKITASALLFLTGSAAIYGGFNLVIQPDGNNMQLSTDLLQYSVFDNFLVPGILLLVVVGLFSVYAMVAVITGFKKYWLLVMFQGGILASWLILQIALIHFISVLHLVMLVIAFVLILTGNELAPLKSEYRNHEA